MKQGASGGTKSLFGGRKDLIEDKTTDPLFVKDGGRYYFYHSDQLGPPQKMTAINGAVVWSAKYSSFGEAMVEIEVVENNLRFAGQYYDQETGLHYNWHRYYDPNMGRYLKPDPIGLDGGINPYVYVQNSPVNEVDPKGLVVPPYPPIFFPPGTPPIIWPPKPPKTIPIVRPPEMPPNIPDPNPSPGNRFEICMQVCKLAAKKALKCPRLVSQIPCFILCIIVSLRGDGF